MNGVLIIDKPAGITSHDVVSRVRRSLNTKRVGHTGTLDPFATGVMVILVGQATRLAQFLDKDEKEYEARVKFGFETDTGDRTGNPKGTAHSAFGCASPMSIYPAALEAALESFRGEIEQVPPMYSAKKIDGKKLYEHARKGETIERKAARVRIDGLEVIDEHKLSEPRSEIDIRVICSAGTYIRTLAEDIGRQLGVGAHLAELRRTRAGQFNIEKAITLDQLNEDPVSTVLIPMSDAVGHLPEFTIEEERVMKTRNGLSTQAGGTVFKDGEPVRMITHGGELIAIGFYNGSENTVLPKVVLV